VLIPPNAKLPGRKDLETFPISFSGSLKDWGVTSWILRAPIEFQIPPVLRKIRLCPFSSTSTFSVAVSNRLHPFTTIMPQQEILICYWISSCLGGLWKLGKAASNVSAMVISTDRAALVPGWVSGEILYSLSNWLPHIEVIPYMIHNMWYIMIYDINIYIHNYTYRYIQHMGA
jgi:hypothetical protein